MLKHEEGGQTQGKTPYLIHEDHLPIHDLIILIIALLWLIICRGGHLGQFRTSLSMTYTAKHRGLSSQSSLDQQGQMHSIPTRTKYQ